MDRASFQRTTLTIELAQLQRRTSTTELAELERRNLTTELAEFDSTALHTEPEQLEAPALKKAALSFDLTTAQLCLQEGSFRHLGGPNPLTNWAQGGVLESTLPSHSLTLDQLELWLPRLGSSLPTGASLEKEASPLSLAVFLF